MILFFVLCFVGVVVVGFSVFVIFWLLILVYVCDCYLVFVECFGSGVFFKFDVLVWLLCCDYCQQLDCLLFGLVMLVWVLLLILLVGLGMVVLFWLVLFW